MNEKQQDKRPVISWTKSTARNENASPQYKMENYLPSEKSFKRVSSGGLLLLLGFSAEAGEYLLASVCPASQPARDGLLPKNGSNNSAAGLGGLSSTKWELLTLPAREMGPLPRDSVQ